MKRVVGLAAWMFVVWELLVFTATLEQVVVGVVAAAALAPAVARLGDVVAPWDLLRPRWLVCAARLAGSVAWRVVRANVGLARRIWSPSRPLASGMVVVSTNARSDGGITGVGLITSWIVDNQIVDVDVRRRRLQYHAVAAPEGGDDEARAHINEPVESRLPTVGRRGG